MEWKEILDKFRSGKGIIKTSEDMLFLQTIDHILHKLASEEACEKLIIENQLMGLCDTRPKEEPVKDGFRFDKCDIIKGSYHFKDHDLNSCYIRNDYHHTKIIEFGIDGHHMKLKIEMVRALLPLLQQFVDKGEIG